MDVHAWLQDRVYESPMTAEMSPTWRRLLRLRKVSEGLVSEGSHARRAALIPESDFRLQFAHSRAGGPSAAD